MLYFTSPESFRVLVLGAIVVAHVKWRELICTILPDPYLDEVFHIPQARAYWDGQWSHWDPKITTPPALYYYSWVISRARTLLDPDFELTTGELRFVNFITLYILLVALYIWKRISKQQVHDGNVLQREFVIVSSPLIFFFSGLYYTDLFSALTVVITYSFWSASTQATGRMQVIYQVLHFAFGALSLLARQTNIFWVAIFLGGLQILRTLKNSYPRQIHDPQVSDAFLEDLPITATSLAQHILHSNEDIIFQLFSDLWPPISLLAAFTGFVIGNGGVVLGDKSNHVATVHLAQMLYIWPAIVFFSWPTLLPSLVSILMSAPNKLQLRARFPRAATVLCFLVIFTLVVHFNTVVHPFILADNRHYTFYIFRILRQPLIKYAAVPIYFICGWLCISALGKPLHQGKAQNEEDVQVSWVIVFLISTGLSLVTAPLVEPRYFLIPWLIWRMHLPGINDYVSRQEKRNSNNKENVTSPRIGPTLQHLVQYSTWVELFWYAFINVITGWMFLYNGFSWPQEQGKVQRFMW
ncbi:hypothetical protein DV736_g5354, partial [Chaetothyriales sp. CBS 134916]